MWTLKERFRLWVPVVKLCLAASSQRLAACCAQRRWHLTLKRKTIKKGRVRHWNQLLLHSFVVPCRMHILRFNSFQKNSQIYAKTDDIMDSHVCHCLIVYMTLSSSTHKDQYDKRKRCRNDKLMSLSRQSLNLARGSLNKHFMIRGGYNEVLAWVVFWSFATEREQGLRVIQKDAILARGDKYYANSQFITHNTKNRVVS